MPRTPKNLDTTVLSRLPGGNIPAGGETFVGAQRSALRAPRKLLSPAEEEVNADLDRLLTAAGMDASVVADMPFEERAYLKQCLVELMTDGQSHTAQSLRSADYKWEPVDIRTFLDDPYYAGDATKALFPRCKDVLIDAYSGDTPPAEMILGGSLGWGKTTLASLGVLYDIYLMTCLVNPHDYYGIMAGSPIVFGLYSVSKEQSADSAFSKIVTWADGSPYFRDKCPRSGNHKQRAYFKGCPLLLITGSQEIHSIGKDMYSFLMDEANFLTARDGADEQARAYAIYNNAKNRLRSRFMQRGGGVPGKTWLISSKRTHAAFLENHIRDSKADLESGASRLYEYAQWEVRDQGLYILPKFKVEIGDRINPHRILQPGEDPRPGSDVITVPGEFRHPFEADIDRALRDLAGVATYGMCPFFRDRRVITDAETTEITHPFTRPEITTSIADDVGIETYFRPELMFDTVMSNYRLRVNPDSPRFVHVDIAFTQDSMGIACVHQDGWKLCRRLRPDGTYYEDKVPMVRTDFVLRIRPPKGSEIDLAKMRAFLISLRDLGLPIHRVTLDGHQSRDTMQILRKINFDAVLYSVDKTDDAYRTLRQAYVEKRLLIYHYATLVRELGELEHNLEEGTVDHPKTSPETGEPGSKDVADALAGAVYNCIIDENAHIGGGAKAQAAPSQSDFRHAGGAIPWTQLERNMR